MSTQFLCMVYLRFLYIFLIRTQFMFCCSTRGSCWTLQTFIPIQTVQKMQRHMKRWTTWYMFIFHKMWCTKYLCLVQLHWYVQITTLKRGYTVHNSAHIAVAYLLIRVSGKYGTVCCWRRMLRNRANMRISVSYWTYMGPHSDSRLQQPCVTRMGCPYWSYICC